jgi:hypothetical protein
MNLPNQISGTFNKNVTLGTGFFKVYKDNALFLTFDETDIIVTGNVFTIDITGLFPNNGDYYINFTTGLFIGSLFGEVYPGITNTTDWAFQITNGEYENTEYSNEYLIN